jgi:chromosome segregation ATPase
LNIHINDQKRNTEFLAEKLSKLENERRNLLADNSSLKQSINNAEDDRDALKNKLNDAANKFEHTFTKQEGAYETQ